MQRILFVGPFLGACFLAHLARQPAQACCPAPPSGKPVVNADQTVIIIWDAQTQTQHFIRQASFKSEADDFGFLVPTPARPELAESGNEAFPFLLKLTEPEKKKMRRPPSGIGCGSSLGPGQNLVSPPPLVQVLEEKRVAGFDAVVLQAESPTALLAWLKEHGYAHSAELEAWAKPYVEAGWKITALKIAKGAEQKERNDVAASALRLSFKTDRPLFPYREPDYRDSAKRLGATRRLLRIYFVADARYKGELTRDVSWTGQVAWAGKLSPQDRQKALKLLKLPESTGPAQWFLTEFEDDWPYKVAPADVYFSRDPNQGGVFRPPIIEYVSSTWPTDGSTYAIATAVLLVVWLRIRVAQKRWRADANFAKA